MRDLVKKEISAIQENYEDVPEGHHPLGKHRNDLDEFLVHATDRQLLDLLLSATTDIAK